MLSATRFDAGPQTVQIIDYQAADSGTTQTDVSLAMQTQGDFTLVWLQHEERTWDTSGYPDSYYSSASRTSTTGGSTRASTRPEPRITDLVDEQGNLVPDGGTIEGGAVHRRSVRRAAVGRRSGSRTRTAC